MGQERTRAVVRLVGGVLALALLAACQSRPQVVVDAPAPDAAKAEEAAISGEYERALTLLGGGDVALATTELEAITAAHPQYPGPLLNLGIAYVKGGKLAEAEQAFKMAISRKPDSAAAYNQLGIVYRRLGRFNEAAEAYQRAVEIQPDYALAHLNLGVLYDLYLQKPELALREFESYVSIAGDADATVNGWIREIKARLDGAARGAKEKS